MKPSPQDVAQAGKSPFFAHLLCNTKLFAKLRRSLSCQTATPTARIICGAGDRAHHHRRFRPARSRTRFARHDVSRCGFLALGGGRSVHHRPCVVPGGTRPLHDGTRPVVCHRQSDRPLSHLDDIGDGFQRSKPLHVEQHTSCFRMAVPSRACRCDRARPCRVAPDQAATRALHRRSA